MSKRQKKREATIQAYKEENTRLIGQIRNLNETVAQFQFIMACFIHQAGGQLEISAETVETIEALPSVEFGNEFDDKRKMFIFRTAYDDKFTKEMIEGIELGT